MRTKHKHYDVIVAWAAGEEIEVWHPTNNQWVPIPYEHPSFGKSDEYRIKPKLVKKEGWVNVYKGSLLTVHTVKHCADNASILGKEKIACIRIEWEEV